MAVYDGTSLPDFLQGTIAADTLNGLAADDVIYGFNGNDLLSGGDGDDILFAGSGDDTIHGGAGEDIIAGQSGNDLVSYSQATAAVTLVIGDAAASTGDAAGDVFTSIERFELSGLDDAFYGGSGTDQVNGGAGNDFLSALAGNDLLQGGLGNDSLCGGLGADTLDGGAGQDFASYAESVDNLRLDFLDMASSSPEVAGDVFLSVEGFVLGTGHDVALAVAATSFRGGGGDDTLQGGIGADTLAGDQGQDVLDGGAGSDRIEAGDEPDVIGALDLNPAAIGANAHGGIGHDTVVGGNMPDRLAGDGGNDQITGGDGNDSLEGGMGNDSLQGDAGDDVLVGGAGRDVLTGGTGADVALYTTAVRFNRADSLASTGEAQGDSLTGIETLAFRGAGSSYDGATLAMAMRFEAGAGVFRAGLGAEAVTGNGTDTLADYTGATRGLSFLATATGVAGSLGEAAGDRLDRVAQLVGGGFPDRFTLTAPGAGLARVQGGAGADLFVLTDSGVAVYGGVGNDAVRGSYAGGTALAPVRIAGDEGDDLIQIQKTAGSAGDLVRLDGGTGNDRLLVQNAGSTQILGAVEAAGGDGNDTLTLRASTVRATGGAGSDTITASGWGMTLDGGTEDDRLTAHLLTGTRAASTIAGGAGQDVITVTAAFAVADALGRLSEVQINGGAGNDTLAGGAAILDPGSAALLLREAFLFTLGDGQDSITGFDDGIDILIFAPGGPQSMADLVITEGQTGTEIAYGSDRIIIAGLAPADVSVADFLFG